jgi:hypothetical protein
LRALPSNPYEIQRPVLVAQRYRPKDDALRGALRISALVFDQLAGASLPALLRIGRDEVTGY